MLSKIKYLVPFLIFTQIPALISAQNADINLLRRINVNRNTSLDHTFKGISDSATPVSFIVPLGILTSAIISKNHELRNKGLVISASIISATVISYSLKHAILRERPFVTYPDLQKLDDAGSPSFPSGHTSTAFSTATSLSLAFPKWYVFVPAYLWAGSVGYSRMHLGVHYPSDVLAGAITGTGAALLCNYINKKILVKKQKKDKPIY